MPSTRRSSTATRARGEAQTRRDVLRQCSVCGAIGTGQIRGERIFDRLPVAHGHHVGCGGKVRSFDTATREMADTVEPEALGATG